MITAVPVAASTTVASTASSWIPICAKLPASQPSPPAGLASFVANTPVSIAPAIPASPWQENTSSESSSRVFARIWIAV